jgi:hypothetical protein
LRTRGKARAFILVQQEVKRQTKET